MSGHAGAGRRWFKLLRGIVVLAMIGQVGCARHDAWLVDQLSRPGVLESPVRFQFDRHRFELFDALKLEHDWPSGLRAKCSGFGIVPVRDASTSTGGLVYAVPAIFERNGTSWQYRSIKPDDPRPMARFTHSAKQMVNSAEQEWGFRPICFNVSVTSHHLFAISLHKRSLDNVVASWQRGAPGMQFSSEVIGSNRWTVGRMPALLPRGEGYGGPYQVWILPLGNTGYTWIMTFGANLESLKYPAEHEMFERVIEHMVASVRVAARN